MAEQETISRRADLIRLGPGDPRRSGLARLLREPGFLPCVCLLILFAVSFQVFAVYKDIQFKKLPLNLRKQLDKLDQQKLYPYVLMNAGALKPEMVDTLGTDQYISWMLRDTSVKDGGPEQIADLFVTYYTGKPDQVPHVPEMCYKGGGYREQDETIQDIPVPSLGISIPVKVLEFEKSHLLGRESRIVIYTFHVNGQFASDRREVQSIMANPLDHYAYFSKLELTFGTQDQAPPKEVAIKAAARLLQVVVPILVKEHWPDWKAENAALKSKNDTRHSKIEKPGH